MRQPALPRARHLALLSSTAIILAGLHAAPLRANDECGIRIIGDSPVTLDNTGLIDGAVITGDGDDRFTSAGTLRTSFVDMGLGNDTLVNSGTLELDGTSGAVDNVESFTNSGVIDLANGSSGDTLSISGNFVSAGGALYLDAALDAGTADLLTLASVASTSNPTLIYVTDVGGGDPASAPILIIDASGALNGQSFSLANSTIGAYEYQLTYDSSAFDWYLELLNQFTGTAEYAHARAGDFEDASGALGPDGEEFTATTALRVAY